MVMATAARTWCLVARDGNRRGGIGVGMRSGGYNVATPGKILDAAEYLFAQKHYGAATLKEIAQEAGVNVNQIVYHFGQKDSIVRDVILRRAGVLTNERLRLLDDYSRIVGPDSVEIEPLVRAFAEPYFQRLQSNDPGWRNYAQFIGRVVWDGKLTDIFAEAFNEAAEQYILAFRRALPSLTYEDSVRAFQFLLAVIYGSTTNDRRINALAQNDRLATDYAGYHNALIPFVAAGIERLAAKASEGGRTHEL